MKILLSKIHNISANLMATPTLSKIKENYPSCEIWLVVAEGTESILHGCLEIDQIRTLRDDRIKPVNKMTQMLSAGSLLKELRQQKFDYAFDLCGSQASRWLCALSAANQAVSVSQSIADAFGWKYIFRSQDVSMSEWQQKHSVERDFLLVSQCLRLGYHIPPLIFSKDRYQYWREPLLEHRFVVFHPSSDIAENLWTIDRWIALGKYLIRRDYAVIVSAGESRIEIDLANRIVHALGKRAVVTDEDLTWGQLAGVLHRAKLLVSVDNPLVYLSAACQCPIIALYGQTSVSLCQPWQVNHQLIFPDNRYSDFDPLTQSVSHIQLHQVQEACQDLLPLK